MKEYLDFAISIAKYAGKIMLQHFQNVSLDVNYKDDKTPVTLVDLKINKYLIEKVNEYYPEHDVDGEEKKKVDGSKYVWVCDPIDGTASFVRGVPISVFSLALVCDGTPIVGVVYDPFLNEIYTSIKGEGSYCNGKKLQVNSKKYGQIGTTVDYYFWANSKFRVLDLVKHIYHDVSVCHIGSVAHGCMLLAKGKISGLIFPGTYHGHCDLAASKLIVEEAGGIVTNFFGNEQRYDQDINGAIMGNKDVHKMLIQKIKQMPNILSEDKND